MIINLCKIASYLALQNFETENLGIRIQSFDNKRHWRNFAWHCFLIKDNNNVSVHQQLIKLFKAFKLNSILRIIFKGQILNSHPDCNVGFIEKNTPSQKKKEKKVIFLVSP